MKTKLVRRLILKIAPYFVLKPVSDNEDILKVIITGLPRSGTSFLTSLVHKMGFSLGPQNWLVGADKYNRYGYFESIPLNRLSDKILKKLDSDFHENLPILELGWIEKCSLEKRQIKNVVQNGNIKLMKDNKVIILADLYDELFPNAKWIFIQRDIEETYRSRFGDPLSFEQWQQITSDRLSIWQSSKPAQKALWFNYEDFKINIDQSIERLQAHLGIELTEAQLNDCRELFKPRS